VTHASRNALRALGICGYAAAGWACNAESRAATPSPSETAPAPPPAPPASGSCGPAPADSGGLLIDDFDANDGRPPRARNRVAYWWSMGDGTGGKLLPDPAEADDTNRKREAGAVHFLARDFKKWGARLGIGLFWSDGALRCPLNASRYAGFKFRARGSGSLAAQLVTRETASPRAGGLCESRCFDHHQLIVQIKPDWTTHSIRWAELRQQGWGEAVPLRTEHIVGVTFAAQVADLPVDVWIDDLEFIAERSR
jgi:hypothetical protein